MHITIMWDEFNIDAQNVYDIHLVNDPENNGK